MDIEVKSFFFQSSFLICKIRSLEACNYSRVDFSLDCYIPHCYLSSTVLNHFTKITLVPSCLKSLLNPIPSRLEDQEQLINNSSGDPEVSEDGLINTGKVLAYYKTSNVYTITYN